MEHTIGGKFKLGRKIGSGSFGELYLGKFICLLKNFFFSCAFRFHAFTITLKAVLMFSAVLFDPGVNVQSGEEVAIKLVCARVHFEFDFLDLFFWVI